MNQEKNILRGEFIRRSTALDAGMMLARAGRLFIIIIPLLFLFTCFAPFNKSATVVAGNGNNNPNPESNHMRIKIGSSTFIATLYDNATTAAFKAMLPMTINMIELNGNEKYFSLSVDLPTNASNPGTIQSGDLMIYGSNTLVLFYKTFSTSYDYTRLGRINDTTGLAAAVGSGSVKVTFELE